MWANFQEERMSRKPGSIVPGLGIGLATFLSVFGQPDITLRALWLTMAGLGALVVVLTVLTARNGNPLGVLSIAIAAVISVSAIAELSAPRAGIEIAQYPYLFAMFLCVSVGFPLGVLAISDPFMQPGAALFWGGVGVIYMPLPLWVLARLGLAGYIINVFDPRLRLGHIVGLDNSNIGVIANILGLAIGGGITLLVVSLPALPVVWAVRRFLGKS
jgi:hypothetical protein